jgi:hypothetical protein
VGSASSFSSRDTSSSLILIDIVGGTLESIQCHP